MFQERTGGYPQGPIFEDYLTAKLACDAMLKCASFGSFICKGTDGNCVSIARRKDVTKLPYERGTIEHFLSMKMIEGMGDCFSYSNGALKFTIGELTQRFVKAPENDDGGMMAIFAYEEYIKNRLVDSVPPVVSTAPVAPVAPVMHVVPMAPGSPVAPVIHVVPMAPVIPVAPVNTCAPVAPVMHVVSVGCHSYSPIRDRDLTGFVPV